jgi:site-specific DNA-adenine methylase
MRNSEFVKSPLQYTGGKFKILKDIFPLFPDEIHTFIDLFGGGFNVGINAEANNIINSAIANADHPKRVKVKAGTKIC